MFCLFIKAVIKRAFHKWKWFENKNANFQFWLGVAIPKIPRGNEESKKKNKNKLPIISLVKHHVLNVIYNTYMYEVYIHT